MSTKAKKCCVNCGASAVDLDPEVLWCIGNGVYQCDPCREEDLKARVKLRQEAGFDHQGTDEAVCPHCGYTYRDSWEMKDGEVFECEECGKDFTLWVNTSISYATSKEVRES